MGRGVVLLVLLALVGGGVYLDRTASEATAPPATRAVVDVSGPVVPPADTVSAAWYCAEGTSVPRGRADETLVIGNLSPSPISASVTVYPGGSDPPVSRSLRVDALEQARVRVAELVPAADPGVVVEVFGGRAVVEHELVGQSGDVAIGPCAREAAREWYFAAGTTAPGVQESFALFNPYGEDAIVDLTFLTSDGVQEPQALQGIVVPRRSRVTVPVQEEVRRADQVAAAVHARVGRIVAERTHVFDGTGGRTGLAVSLGATGRAQDWKVPAGSTATGGTSLVVVANFERTPTTVEVSAVLDDSSVLEPQALDVPARSVAPVDLGGRVPVGTGYTVVVHAAREGRVVVEALTVRPSGAATTVGSASPARRWGFAIGAVPGTNGRLSVFNPGPEPRTAELLAYTPGDPDSPPSAPARALAPGGRATFDLGELGIGADQVLVVRADGPVVVGRELDEGGLSLAPGIPFAS